MPPRRIRLGFGDAFKLYGEVLKQIFVPAKQMQWSDIKERMELLTSEGQIATFLAGVQGQILSVTASNNSKRVAVAANALSFAGILFDVVAACLAFRSSTNMRTRVVVVDDLLREIDLASEAEIQTWQLRDIMASRGLPLHDAIGQHLRNDLWALIVQHMTHAPDRSESGTAKPGSGSKIEGSGSPEGLDSQEQMDISCRSVKVLREACYSAEIAYFVADTADFILGLGVCCFLTSSVCLAVSTQPVSVWVLAIVACTSLIVFPACHIAYKLLERAFPSPFLDLLIPFKLFDRRSPFHG